ncbi:unnamed protein product [Phaedon cochleariae]|uniref:Carboxylesterase type B domain-containing protein n=1 Tax=Phaedon cochleariae TaxID=80249 RepID=A0A9P0DQ06_PHACE|nr:unnamed protein product [Phaedon cochleariae]
MEEPIVSTQEGQLIGSIKSAFNDESFFSFQGIPYAKPPLGELRFKAPLPPDQWDGIRDATREGDECYAKNLVSIYTGSENCLCLNVFTKEICSRSLRPVMLWIHGGGFTSGSSRSEIYDPSFLMTEDIVLVTLNYRIGPLGFLHLQDSSLGVPGNAGLKDIVMALQWVRRNISQFSGDPNNVTIFGESAGGAAVHLLMLSPMARGLFHKAIAQSGCATNHWATCRSDGVRHLAEALGIYTNDDRVLLKHLQEMSVEELIGGMERVPDPFLVGKFRPFGPIIEKKSTYEPGFLTENPVDIIKSGNFNQVPFITGCVEKEGMFVYSLCTTGKKNTLLVDESLVPNSLNLRIGSEQYNKAVDKIKKFYFSGNEDPSNDLDSILKVYGHNFFLYEIYKTAQHHLESSNTPIYFYLFAVDTELNFMKSVLGVEGEGVCHADDIAYLFKNMLTPEELEPNGPEVIGIHRMVKMWTNFAKYSNPTPNNNDPLIPVTWQPINKSCFNVLRIGTDDLQLLNKHPDVEGMDFWDEMYQKYALSSKL